MTGACRRVHPAGPGPGFRWSRAFFAQVDGFDRLGLARQEDLVVDPLPELRGALGVDQPQVVDPGRRRRGRDRGLGLGFGVRVPGDQVRDRLAEGAAAEADVDVGQVEGVEDQLDLTADQRRVDVVGVGLERDRGGPGDLPQL